MLLRAVGGERVSESLEGRNWRLGRALSPDPGAAHKKKEAGRQKSRVTSSNFITVGKAGVSITSEESRFSRIAAAERSNDPERQSGLKGWDRDPREAVPDACLRDNHPWVRGTASPRPPLRVVTFLGTSSILILTTVHRVCPPLPRLRS